MTNDKMMELMRRIGVNHQQRKIIYTLGGLFIISICGCLFLYSKGKKLTLSLGNEKQETDKLISKLFESTKIRNEQKKEIQKLASQVKDLQIQLDEKNKTN